MSTEATRIARRSPADFTTWWATRSATAGSSAANWLARRQPVTRCLIPVSMGPMTLRTIPIEYLRESGSLEAQAAAYAAAYFSAVPAVVGPSGTGCIATGQNATWRRLARTTFSISTRGAEFRRWSRNYGAVLSVGGVVILLRRGWRKVGCKASNCCDVPIQNEYQLAQVEFGFSGANAPIWGIVTNFDSDFGPTFPHLRPIAMGMEVVNSAHRRGLLPG